MRVLLLANQGHGTTALRTTQQLDADIVAVVSKPRPALRARVRRRLRRVLSPFHDPFVGFDHPSRLGERWLPSRDLNRLPDLVEEPDLLLCCTFHRRVPEAVLDWAGLAVNIHPGLLPERGGGTPNRWAVLQGDKESGVTAHVMTPDFDAGDILWQSRTPIPPDETWGNLELRLTPLIRDAVRHVLQSLGEGRPLSRTPQTPNIDPPLHIADLDEPEAPSEVNAYCRAFWPKGCAMRRCRWRQLSRRPCGL